MMWAHFLHSLVHHKGQQYIRSEVPDRFNVRLKTTPFSALENVGKNGLKAGIMDDVRPFSTFVGAPQGEIISPLSQSYFQTKSLPECSFIFPSSLRQRVASSPKASKLVNIYALLLNVLGYQLLSITDVFWLNC